MPWLAWSDAEELDEAYKSGAGAWKLYHDFPHSYSQIKAYLQYLGMWRNKSKAQRVRQRREHRGTHTISDAPWVASELDAITHGPSIALRGFVPMLTVDIRTGKLLLNRMADALEPFDRFPVRRCGV